MRDIFLKGWRPYAWIAVIIALVYSKAIWYGFTYLDDNILILGNMNFLRDISNSWDSFFLKVFPRSYLPYYRPLLTISLILDAQLSGASPVSYHASNIIFHFAATCLLFTFLGRMGYRRDISFLFSMIFAVHPVLSQGVAWIAGRNDTLLAVFILSSFIFFMDYIKDGAASRYMAHMVFFMLALFTKETALITAPMCLFYMHAISGERLFSRHEKALAAGWLVVIFLWSFMRSGAVEGSKSMNYYEMGSLIFAYLPAAVQFLGKVFFPFNLSVFPIIRDTAFIYGAVAIFFLVFSLAATKRRRDNYVIFGLLWMALFMAPSLIRANTRLVADFLEHRVYVPVIGCIIVLCETDAIRRLSERKTAMWASAAAVIALFASITFIHIDNFKDQFSFWRNAAKTASHSSFSHLALAVAYHDAGMEDAAMEEYRKCLALDPMDPSALYGIGNIYMRRGMLDDAEKQFKKAKAAYPAYDNAYMALGVVRYRKGDLRGAERMWNKAIATDPRNISAYRNLAIYYGERKDFTKAAICARQLQRLGAYVPEDFLKYIEMK
ncbi:MAG: tetratricopeptide repeat protein [Candidatus Omnitrophica bacterium]|nr:tetratricopeptide repeat protein [Candidatus Omnitrophota bacterium]